VKQFKHRYASRYTSVTQARRDVVAFTALCGLHEHDIADVALAVGEACNNAAEHGHVNGGFFTLRCTCSAGRLTVDVLDEGKGFLLAGKGERMDPESRGVRGLGIFLMRALMDDVSYEMAGHGTRVRLIKKIEAVQQLAVGER